MLAEMVISFVSSFAFYFYAFVMRIICGAMVG